MCCICHTPTDDVVESEEAYFAELGYEIDIDADRHGYGFDVLSFPDGTTEIEAQGYVQANLFYKRYRGDWQFVLPLR